MSSGAIWHSDSGFAWEIKKEVNRVSVRLCKYVRTISRNYFLQRKKKNEYRTKKSQTSYSSNKNDNDNDKNDYYD